MSCLKPWTESIIQQVLKPAKAVLITFICACVKNLHSFKIKIIKEETSDL